MLEASETTADKVNRSSYIFLNVASAFLSADIERLCLEENLTEAHFRILWVLCRESSTSGRPMGDIADGLVNRAADVTRLVDKLEKNGLVTRERFPEDKRRIIARATPLGRKVFQRLAKRIRKLHIEQWSALSHTEQRQLIRLLDKVVASRTMPGAGESWLLRKGAQ